MRTVTVVASVAALPAAPDSVGVAVASWAPLAGAGRVTDGAFASTEKVRAALVPTLPAPSLCCAVMVYVPSARVAGWTDHVVPEAVVERVWTGVPVAAEPE